MSFKKRLKLARINKDLKQNEAANLLEIPSANLSTYERGISEPDIATLKKIAELYEVSLDYLVGVENENIQSSLSHPLNDTVQEALHEMDASDIQLLSTEDIDKETAKAIKMALQNGIKLVDSMRQREHEED